MSISIIIGNGFDINCGAKTSYKDMYPYYIKETSSKQLIKKFKEDLSKDYESWADFEMGMAKYAASLSSENDFVECVHDFYVFMLSYLRKEEDRIINLFKQANENDVISYAICNSFIHFYEKLPITSESLSFTDFEERVQKERVNIFSFNYTSKVVKEIMAYLSNSKLFNIKNSLTNIHGRLDTNPLLGVDNLNQFRDLKYEMTDYGKSAFVKPLANNMINPRKNDEIATALMNSSLIFAFGWSMGESDERWINYIREWLKNEQHHLIVFSSERYTEGFVYFPYVIHEASQRKEYIMNKLGFSESEKKHSSNIHILLSENPMNIELMIKEQI